MKVLIFILLFFLVSCQKENLEKSTRSAVTEETKEDSVKNDGVNAEIWVDTTYNEYDFNFDLKY
mgnify:CR=1 FL=1